MFILLNHNPALKTLEVCPFLPLPPCSSPFLHFLPFHPTGENLYKKEFSPMGRKWRKRRKGEERVGRGRKGPTSNVFRAGLWFKRMNTRPKVRIISFTLYFGLQRGRCKRQKHMYINVNLWPFTKKQGQDQSRTWVRLFHRCGDIQGVPSQLQHKESTYLCF